MEYFRPSEENRERISQDILFIRMFLDHMNQCRVMRWREDGESAFSDKMHVSDMYESVAEHAGMMNALSNFIFEKALFEGDESFLGMNERKINNMIQLHDTEEIITGDARVKNAAHNSLEHAATATVKERLKEINFGSSLADTLSEYRERKTKEAKYVKAIDELQAWLYILFTRRFDAQKRDFTNVDTIQGYVHSKEFPTLHRIMNIVLRVMRNPSSFTSDIPNLELLREQYSRNHSQQNHT